MADLRIADAPEIDESEVQGGLKIPTGGFGNKAINMNTVASWVVKDKDLPSKDYVDDKFNQGNQGLSGHVANKNNPHEVTKEQVGLGNVDNTADADKPVSNATSAALNLKADKSQLQGLATTTQLDAKADKSSTYTKTEVDGVVDDLYQSLEDNFVANGAALPYDPQVTYNDGAIVVDNGALKKVDGGQLLPAVDAKSISVGDSTLEVFAEKTSQNVATIADMIAIQNPKNGLRVSVKSYRAPTNLTLNEPYVGGGEFVFVSNLVAQNDGVFVFDGFVRLDQNITPYCAGAFGDGVTDDTQYIQRYFDCVAKKTNKDAPLGGDFLIDQVLLKSQHNDLIVRDGKLKKITNPAQTNLALIEVGHKSNTDDDISGMLFKNLVLEASAQYTGDYNVDDPVNTASKQFCTGINVVANPNARVKSIFFDNIHGIHLGNAVVNINGADYSSLKTITSDKVNKHTVGASVTYFGAISAWPADFNPVFDVNGVNAIESGTIFDLSTVGSSKDDFGDKCATAIMANLNGTDLTLRTKIHGYWDTQITNFTSIRKQFAGQPLAPYAGIDVANERIKRLKINNITVEGAIAGIISDNKLEGDTQITNLTVKNSLRGLIARCAGKVTVNGFNTENCFEQYIVGNDTSLEINGFNFKKCRKSYWQAQIAGYSGITLSAYPIQGAILNHSLLNGSFEDFGEDDAANTPPAYLAFLTVKGTNNISNVKFANPSAVKCGNGLYFETATGATTYLSDITEKDKFVTSNIIRSQGTTEVDGTENQMLTLTRNLRLLSNVNEKFACTLSNSGNFWMWLGVDGKPRFSLSRPLARTDGEMLGSVTSVT